MIFKKLFLFSFLILAFFPFYKLNAENPNSGLVPGSIWYSQDSFEEGDKIKIYTLVFNPENKELIATVKFFDKDVILGQKEIKVPAKSTKDVSVDWTVTAGKHTIYATLENTKFLVSGKYETALLSKIETDKDTVLISKKITTNSPEKESSSDTDTNTILNLIKEKTPSFISKPIIIATDALEKFRLDTAEKTDTRKEILQKELEEIKTPENQDTETEANSAKTQKTWKQIQLIALQTVSFVFNNQYAFYTVLFILVFLVLRYIWLKIF